MRAAIYARVSTFDQEPENQLQELRRYVEALRQPSPHDHDSPLARELPLDRFHDSLAFWSF